MKRLNGNPRRKIEMKLKTAFLMLLVTIFSFSGVMTANAATISDDGQYTLILDLRSEDFEEGDIDGSTVKVIRLMIRKLKMNWQYQILHLPVLSGWIDILN